MSQAPTRLQSIAALLPLIVAAQKAVELAETRLRILELRNGQDLASVSVNGISVSLTYGDRETGWMPRVVPGRQALLAECRKAVYDNLISERGKLEGLEFQLRNLAKGESREH